MFVTVDYTRFEVPMPHILRECGFRDADHVKHVALSCGTVVAPMNTKDVASYMRKHFPHK